MRYKTLLVFILPDRITLQMPRKEVRLLLLKRPVIFICQRTDAQSDLKLAMLKEFSHFDPGVIQTIEYVPRTSEFISVETSWRGTQP